MLNSSWSLDVSSGVRSASRSVKVELILTTRCFQHCWKTTSRDFWSSRNERKPLSKLKHFFRKCCRVSQKWWMFCLWVRLYLLISVQKCLLLILVACWHLYLSDNPVKHKISPLYDLFNTIYIFTSCLSDLQLRSDLKFKLSGFYSWACHMIACTSNWLASTQGASISNLWWEIHSRK